MGDNSQMDSFRERLVYYRDLRGFNNRTLSLSAGIAEGGVRDLLEKTSSPRVDTLLKLCKALDVSPIDLYPELEAHFPIEVIQAMHELRDLEKKRNEAVKRVMKKFRRGE